MVITQKSIFIIIGKISLKYALYISYFKFISIFYYIYIINYYIIYNSNH